MKLLGNYRTKYNGIIANRNIFISKEQSLYINLNDEYIPIISLPMYNKTKEYDFKLIDPE